MEGTLILATVVQKLRVELLPDHPIVPATPFALRPKYGVKATLRAR
jgi:hypothetical protein